MIALTVCKTHWQVLPPLGHSLSSAVTRKDEGSTKMRMKWINKLIKHAVSSLAGKHAWNKLLYFPCVWEVLLCLYNSSTIFSPHKFARNKRALKYGLLVSTKENVIFLYVEQQFLAVPSVAFFCYSVLCIIIIIIIIINHWEGIAKLTWALGPTQLKLGSRIRSVGSEGGWPDIGHIV